MFVYKNYIDYGSTEAIEQYLVFISVCGIYQTAKIIAGYIHKHKLDSAELTHIQLSFLYKKQCFITLIKS